MYVQSGGLHIYDNISEGPLAFHFGSRITGDTEILAALCVPIDLFTVGNRFTLVVVVATPFIRSKFYEVSSSRSCRKSIV